MTLRSSKLGLALCGLLLAIGVLAPRTHASEWDKRTIVTVNQPMQVRDTLLQPGTYVFKLLDSSADRHVVQIFNGDESHIINTILAIPAERRMDQVTGHTEFFFYETPGGYAKALRDWYYPGDVFGQHFTYPKHLSLVETASVTKEEAKMEETTRTEEVTPVPETKTEVQAENKEEMKEEVKNEEVKTEEQPIPEVTPVAPPQQPAPPAAPEPPASLPKTASPYPLYGMVGLFSLGLYGLLRRRSA